MVVESIQYRCKNCETELSKDEIPCKNCGSTSRNISLVLRETLQISDIISRVKVKNPDIPGYKYERTNKNKISGGTKLPAKESMIIDRTDNDVTIKHHIVMEKEGKDWIVKHDEIQDFEAKRRKKK